MLTTLSRIFKYGGQNFTRNAWLSTATVLVMILSLVAFAGLNLLNMATSTIISSIQDKIDISVYFKSSTAEDDVLRIKSTLESLPEVKAVEYVSKDQALEIFKSKHQNDQTITQAISQLNENPLLPSLNIKAKDTGEYGAINQYLQNDSIAPFVERVSYSQNQTIIDRLNKILKTAETGGLALTIFMSLVAILITFNTIRLAIYSNRESITIMRLVGGSNFFVRGPFLVEGVLYGALSAIISVFLIMPVVYFISPYGTILVPELDMWGYFTSHIFGIFFTQLLFGVLLGLISSFFAIQKYLKE
ncbi:MAG: ABC transporter permease [Patescibacteria group bacterium]|nr:ABC transporter permease [Patescibacteria group bacterium]